LRLKCCIVPNGRQHARKFPVEKLKQDEINAPASVHIRRSEWLCLNRACDSPIHAFSLVQWTLALMQFNKRNYVVQFPGLLLKAAQELCLSVPVVTLHPTARSTSVLAFGRQAEALK